jgi:hypothetical protein
MSTFFRHRQIPLFRDVTNTKLPTNYGHDSQCSYEEVHVTLTMWQSSLFLSQRDSSCSTTKQFIASTHRLVVIYGCNFHPSWKFTNKCPRRNCRLWRTTWPSNRPSSVSPTVLHSTGEPSEQPSSYKGQMRVSCYCSRTIIPLCRWGYVCSVTGCKFSHHHHLSNDPDVCSHDWSTPEHTDGCDCMAVAPNAASYMAHGSWLSSSVP